jgi:hypothetical protein
MGGLVARLMVTNTGYDIWDLYFRSRPGQLRIDPAQRQKLQDLLIFRPRPDVSRVVFLAVPHRGSALAANFIGRIAVMLVHLPERMINLGASTVEFLANPDSASRRPSFPTSIETLAPNNRFLLALNRLYPTVPYHSIIGDRGRGNTPNSSDGVVPYWSSHLAGAQSEKIVPTGHTPFFSPLTTAEINRILQENAAAVRPH